MDANTCSPSDLFQGRQQYVIPPFQRPYVWTEEMQWAPLWDDVRRVASTLVEADLSGSAAEGVRHFLGAVVYESQKAVAGRVNEHDVIDGQQRMTTLQLLLDAARLVIARLAETVDESDRALYDEHEEALAELVENT